MNSIIDGFDFKGGHFTATFTANSTVATVDIPIIADFILNEGTESFTVQLSLQSHRILSDLPYTTRVRLGSIPQATVFILEEIVLSIQDAEVIEGTTLALTVTASTASNSDFNFTVEIAGKNQDTQCKLLCNMYIGEVKTDQLNFNSTHSMHAHA